MTSEIPRISRRKFLTGLASVTVTGGVLSTVVKSSNRSVKEEPKVIGHRGFSSEYPDNSLKGIRRAAAVGADGVEIDVRKTSDGELVLYHDPAIFDSNSGVHLISSTPYEELANNHSRYLPRLEEGINIASNNDLELFIELKDLAALDKILQVVRSNDYIQETTLLSWEPSVPAEKNRIECDLGLLGVSPNIPLLREAQSNEFDLVIPHFVSSSVDYFYELCKSTSLESGFWSITDTHDDVYKGLTLNPDVVITNHPDISSEIQEK